MSDQMTEHLRALLDARGVEWEALSDTQQGEYTITATRWHDSEGGLLTMCIDKSSGSTWDFFWLPTPEQAVEATVGRGTCKMEGTFHGQTEVEEYFCTACNEYTDVEVPVFGSVKPPRYCPNCGRKVSE